MSMLHHPRRVSRLAFALLCSAGIAPPLGAADAPAPAPPAAVQESLPVGGNLRVIGRDVKGPSGVVVAQVVNVLVDPAGQPRAAVLDYGGFLGVGRRRIAVAWQALRFAPEGITLELSRDQLRAFPDYKDGETVVVAIPPDAPAATPE